MMIMEVENERLIKLIWPWQMPFLRRRGRGANARKIKMMAEAK